VTERAFNVFFGVILIVNVWLWAFIAQELTDLHGWGWLGLAGKVVTACFITAPIYREYLR